MDDLDPYIQAKKHRELGYADTYWEVDDNCDYQPCRYFEILE